MDNSIYIWIFAIPIIAFVLAALFRAFVPTESQSLNKKFIELGVLKGKTYDEIVEYVGSPNSIDKIDKSVTLCQWVKPAYHISLLFDRNMICLGVHSETKVDEPL